MLRLCTGQQHGIRCAGAQCAQLSRTRRAARGCRVRWQGAHSSREQRCPDRPGKGRGPDCLTADGNVGGQEAGRVRARAHVCEEEWEGRGMFKRFKPAYCDRRKDGPTDGCRDWRACVRACECVCMRMPARVHMLLGQRVHIFPRTASRCKKY